MLPSTCRLLTQPAPAPVTVNAAPLVSGLLNSLTLSPTARAGPRFITVNFPVPPLVSAPLTDATSLDGDTNFLILNNRLPFKVRPPLRVSVPMAEEVPGARGPPRSEERRVGKEG